MAGCTKFAEGARAFGASKILGDPARAAFRLRHIPLWTLRTVPIVREQHLSWLLPTAASLRSPNSHWRGPRSHLPVRGRLLDVDVAHPARATLLLAEGEATNAVRCACPASLKLEAQSFHLTHNHTELPKLAPHGRRHVAPGRGHRYLREGGALALPTRNESAILRLH